MSIEEIPRIYRPPEGMALSEAIREVRCRVSETEEPWDLMWDGFVVPVARYDTAKTVAVKLETTILVRDECRIEREQAERDLWAKLETEKLAWFARGLGTGLTIGGVIIVILGVAINHVFL